MRNIYILFKQYLYYKSILYYIYIMFRFIYILFKNIYIISSTCSDTLYLEWLKYKYCLNKKYIVHYHLK